MTEVVAPSPNSAEWGIVASMGLDFGDMRHANARLIAAAPELLTSLTECLAALDQLHREGLREYHPVAITARTAISKATGN